MAVLAAVFLLFYLLALLVISRFAKELLAALFSGRLIGNNVDSKDEEVEVTDTIDSVEAGSLGVANMHSGEEEPDGVFTHDRPTSNGAEAIEMEEIRRRPSDPGNGVTNVTQSLPRTIGETVNSTPKLYQRAQTISRFPLRRQRTSVSESSPMGAAKCKPSVLDILSGRYEDHRVRSDSASRGRIGSSSGDESTRQDSVSSAGRRNPFNRARTISESEPRTVKQPQRGPLRRASSESSPIDTERPLAAREREGVQHASNPSLTSRGDTDPRLTMSLPIGATSSSSGSTAHSPLKPPLTPSVLAGTPLDSIKEEDTLPRTRPRQRSQLTRIASVDESESLIASNSSESSRSSGSGTPVLSRYSPSSAAKGSPGGRFNLQKTASKEEELLTPLITTDPAQSGLGALAPQESSGETGASSVGTPNVVMDQMQPQSEVPDPASLSGLSPLLSAQSPPANGQVEEEEVRPLSTQPLAEPKTGEMGDEHGEDEPELRDDDREGDFLMDPNLAEMTFPEGKAAQQQSNRLEQLQVCQYAVTGALVWAPVTVTRQHMLSPAMSLLHDDTCHLLCHYYTTTHVVTLYLSHTD